jgi:hypothetical protein
MGKTKEENIELLDSNILKKEVITTDLKKGNANDKIVAALVEEKVNNTWVKQKEELEGTEPE